MEHGTASGCNQSSFFRRVAISVLEGPISLPLFFIETTGAAKAMNMPHPSPRWPFETLSVAQLCRDRTESKNSFVELENQLGWGVYTLQDFKRCRLVSRLVASIYNGWSMFTRLDRPGKPSEAISRRPLLLNGVAKQITLAGAITTTIPSGLTNNHIVQSALPVICEFFYSFKTIAV